MVNLNAMQCIGLLFVAMVGMVVLVVIPALTVSGRISQAEQRSEALRRLRDIGESESHADLD